MPNPFPHVARRCRASASASVRFTLLFGVCAIAKSAAAAAGVIAIDPAASPLEQFAARELQRYVYLCTGRLLPIDHKVSPAASPGFVVATQSRPIVSALSSKGGRLGPQSYRLLTAAADGKAERLWIVGGDDVGTLYGVYRFAEKLGVRFYLHGDVVPETPVSLRIPALDETGRPLFSVRGLQPFHDFAEGPDWWNTDDYLAAIGQLAKLRMNFLGLHTYPDSQVGPEPTVWIGPRDDFDAHGRVRSAYPASYHTTGRSGRTWWNYAPTRTSDFVGGAAELFDRDDFGGDVMRDLGFAQQTPESAATVFNRTAAMLGTAFAEARRLGVFTCLGTETPLTLPPPVRAELARQGKNPDDPVVTREIYAAMFERIDRACPADYYWLWTPENWTWEGNHPEEFEKTAADIRAALGALHDVNSPMTLATCGWVLGPQQDRAALDRLLPPSSPMSAINSSVGHVAIDRQFANLSDRPRWAIPWLENDGDLTSPELWTARMRFDAADALRLGCTGLIGIHWRTHLLAPAISALAAAAWDQSWVPADFDPTRIPPLTASGATGGHGISARGDIAGTDDPAPFQTNRVGMHGYDLLVPSGDYTLRLGFSELEHVAPGARVFSVKLNGKLLIDHLDLAAQPGANHAVRFDFPHTRVDEGRLLLEFVAGAGEPAIASIELAGTTDVGRVNYTRRINCGGPPLPGYEADELPGQPRPPVDRAMPVDAFYRDFAATNFGPGAAGAIGAIFTAIDGVKLPAPSQWIDGPGDIRRNPEPWSTVSAHYDFVAQLEALRPQVRGAANLDRYDYWLNQFRALRLIAEIGCTAGALDREMTSLASVADPAAAKARAEQTALPLRLRLGELWTQLLRTEVAGVTNLGELGTLANLEQHSRVHQEILGKHDDVLKKLLGCDLPLAAAPERNYVGRARIVVPTVRTSAAAGEPLKLRALLVSEQPPPGATLCWRALGDKTYTRVPFAHVTRRVFEATLPPLNAATPAIEYHLEAHLDGAALRWPASDRGRDQIVVLFE